MKRQFRLPVSKWSLIWFPLVVLLQIPSILDQYSEFREEPGWKTGWMVFAWALIGLFWLNVAIRRFRTADVVSVEDGEISFQPATGKRTGPPETVTIVTDDQIAFHLFSQKAGISLSRKRVPAELTLCLEERALADSVRNRPALEKTNPAAEAGVDEE